jgi:flavin-dependent dehydrogenase
LRARWLVDATGRKAFIARKLGCRVEVIDRLIGAVEFLPRSVDAQGTLIEAVENGWWYSAPLPGARTVFAYMTDSDLWRASRWEELLKAAPLTSERADVSGTLPPIRVVSAASMLRRPVVGPNWIAVGDAAYAVDPLSGQGIYKTIETGLRSAAVVARAFGGDTGGVAEYETWIAESFRSYLAVRHQFYTSVERWRGSSFWQRRMVA